MKSIFLKRRCVGLDGVKRPNRHHVCKQVCDDHDFLLVKRQGGITVKINTGGKRVEKGLAVDITSPCGIYCILKCASIGPSAKKSFDEIKMILG